MKHNNEDDPDTESEQASDASEELQIPKKIPPKSVTKTQERSVAISVPEGKTSNARTNEFPISASNEFSFFGKYAFVCEINIIFSYNKPALLLPSYYY